MLETAGMAPTVSSLNHRLLRHPLLYHPHPKIRPKQGLIQACLDLVLGWGDLRIPTLKKNSESAWYPPKGSPKPLERDPNFPFKEPFNGLFGCTLEVYP